MVLPCSYLVFRTCRFLRFCTFSSTTPSTDSPQNMFSFSTLYTRPNREVLRTIVAYLPVVGLLCVVCLMPFYYGPLQRWSLYVTAGLYILDYIINKRWQSIGWNRQRWVYVAFIVFFLCFPIRQAFDPYYSDQFVSVIERNLPFLIFGAIGLIGITNKIRIEQFAWAMWAVSCGIAIYIALQTAALHIENWTDWIMAYNRQRITHINTHMVVNMYWNLTIVLCLYTLIQQREPLLARISMGIGLLPVVAGLLITEGRTGLLTFVGILLITLLYYTLHNKKWILIPFIILLALGGGVGLSHRDRFQEATTQKNPRLYIWSVVVDMIEEHPIVGYGVCSARKEFVERGLQDSEFNAHYASGYIAQERGLGHTEPDLNRMHPHNAFLDTWIQVGILGVVVLALCLLLPLTMRLGARQLYMDLCIFTFFMQMLFESIGTQLNALFLCTMLIIIHYHGGAESASVPCSTGDTVGSK